jgi:hypothetical protein
MSFVPRPSRAVLAFVFALAAAIAIVGCGGGASSAAPGVTPVPTPAADRTPGPSGAPELAAMLPDTAGGTDFVKSSFSGADVEGLGLSLDEKVLSALAVNNKVTLEDIEIAEARPRDAGRGGLVVAIRVPGADPQTIVDATFSKSEALQLRTMGGKSVYDVAGSGLNAVVYLKDDVMFQVLGAPSDLTEAIVKALP